MHSYLTNLTQTAKAIHAEEPTDNIIMHMLILLFQTQCNVTLVFEMLLFETVCLELFETRLNLFETLF